MRVFFAYDIDELECDFDMNKEFFPHMPSPSSDAPGDDRKFLALSERLKKDSVVTRLQILKHLMGGSSDLSSERKKKIDAMSREDRIILRTIVSAMLQEVKDEALQKRPKVRIDSSIDPGTPLTKK